MLASDPSLAWVQKTPYEVRDAAMADFQTAFRINVDLVKQGKRDKFEMRWRSRKDRSQTILIRRKHWNCQKGDYAPIFSPEKLRSSEPLLEGYDYDMRLQLTRLGEFYLCIPSPLEVRSDNQAPPEEIEAIISLDPGVRTFVTGYDPSSETYTEWGKGDMGRIYRLCHFYDRLQSKRAGTEKRRNKTRMYRAGLRIQKKIRGLVDDLHRKCAKWLCENFRVVLLPLFETSKMIRKGQRRLRSKTARAMTTWAHYRFRQSLLDKAREYPWCKVVLVTEEYTSKTCGGCGFVNERLGGAKSYRCPRCLIRMDRDFNGARNIFLKYLTEMSGGD
jgi:putative transposase